MTAHDTGALQHSGAKAEKSGDGETSGAMQLVHSASQPRPSNIASAVLSLLSATRSLYQARESASIVTHLPCAVEGRRRVRNTPPPNSRPALPQTISSTATHFVTRQSSVTREGVVKTSAARSCLKTLCCFASTLGVYAQLETYSVGMYGRFPIP